MNQNMTIENGMNGGQNIRQPGSDCILVPKHFVDMRGRVCILFSFFFFGSDCD